MNATDAQVGAEAAAVEDAAPLAGDEWATVLWDDPVTLRPYVVRVLMRRFGHSAARADALTSQAELEGRAVVAHGAREEQEMHVAGLHADGLVATLERMPGGAQ
ncbi:ATP-dependent Clp protease adaptor protein ClpS [Agrococcus baldri]|uniref:ATP-dependent Clp protease adaptor protein ClpS n=1 Tax=Agrococcus baldri TaxID=153730 RepID=A0AA94HJM4_9MICO|nr:ATP-dependent Clp protease adaptor ClpS [Agrococcus baldri]SFR97029.1 ATP-dependent Clp protease adaptor protein ClpS [Agrococcus baldri]